MSNSILQQATNQMLETSEQIKLGGGERGIDRQHHHGRLTARERIELLKDKGSADLECGLFIASGIRSNFRFWFARIDRERRMLGVARDTVMQ